jgi:uncharacterized protein (DUF1778 family)
MTMAARCNAGAPHPPIKLPISSCNDGVVTLSCNMALRSSPRETLNLRIRPEERSLIDRAAASLGKTRTDFVLEAARGAAEQTLVERAFLQVDSKAYAAFLKRLDAPPRPNARLKRSLRTPPPWD